MHVEPAEELQFVCIKNRKQLVKNVMEVLDVLVEK